VFWDLGKEVASSPAGKGQVQRRTGFF